MTKAEHALALAALGFRVFPLEDNGKKPRIKDWQAVATCDEPVVRSMWQRYENANIGIATDEWLVVDVDVKGANGFEALELLQMQGDDLPTTRWHFTPTGGAHLFFRPPGPVKQGVHVLGPGVDIRARGGYVVGPGSAIDNLPYTVHDASPIADAPQWLVDLCGKPRERKSKREVAKVDQTRAVARAEKYLASAEPSVEGSRNQAAYRVACRVRDFGVEEDKCLALLTTWNDQCSPPLELEELQHVARSAYTYALDNPGNAAPENIFKDHIEAAPTPEAEAVVRDSIEGLNAEYAFLITGAAKNVLWETTDPYGRRVVKLLTEQTFHRALAIRPKVTFGDKSKPLSEVWMEHPNRRTFDGTVFAPEQNLGPRWYNYWRGFTHPTWGEPISEAPEDWKWSLQAWKDHLYENVCRGEPELALWLTAWFAHIIQKPYVKPLVATVYRGGKGTGKNALVERVAALLGESGKTFAGKRYLVSNFNAHMERVLLMVLDEVVWGGDKQADGILKHLVTGHDYQIEQKGAEVYTAPNLSRVAIIGNDDWLVPASLDERRYAVFEVGDGRKQDRAFFERMREGMEAGGYQLLMRYLRDFDISQVDLNAAPITPGLYKQKQAGFHYVETWWEWCLRNGTLYDTNDMAWPSVVPKKTVYESVRTWKAKNDRKDYDMTETRIGMFLVRDWEVLTPKNARIDGVQRNCYAFPPLAEARAAWERVNGQTIDWTETDV